MKTNFFIAACLLLCLTLNPVQAQNGKNGTGSNSYWVDLPVLFVIEVGGVQVDYITGFLPYHWSDFSKNGAMVWSRGQAHGIVYGDSGKAYRVNSISQPVQGEYIYWPHDNPWTPEVEEGIWIWEPSGAGLDHLVCEDGSVYIMKYVWSLLDLLEGGSGFVSYEIRVAGKKQM